MFYQMSRLRRMAATFELQKEASLRKHAEAITLNVFPDGHPQERVVAGVWLLSVTRNGVTLTRLEMLQSLKEHELTHRAQLFLYLRMKGIVPATTRRRLAKAGSK